MAKKIDFQCCFCAESIRAPDKGVSLQIPLEDDGIQHLRCHLRCFQAVLHPSVPLEKDILDDWDSPIRA